MTAEAELISDLVVIGGGAAASTASHKLRGSGVPERTVPAGLAEPCSSDLHLEQLFPSDDSGEGPFPPGFTPVSPRFSNLRG